MTVTPPENGPAEPQKSAPFVSLASHRWWWQRVGVWLGSGVVLYLLSADATSDVGAPVFTEAPRLAASGYKMSLSWIGALALTVVLEGRVAFQSSKTAPRNRA